MHWRFFVIFYIPNFEKKAELFGENSPVVFKKVENPKSQIFLEIIEKENLPSI